MNKATVKKLEKLHKLFKKHEEAVEENFTAKQVAIAKYRMGYDEGAANPTRLHELSEVSAHFKCSISYVTKIMRDVSDFLKEMERNYKKNPASRVVAAGKGRGRKLHIRHEKDGEEEVDFDRGKGAFLPESGILIDLGKNMGKATELPDGHHIVVIAHNILPEIFGETLLRIFKTTELHSQMHHKLNNTIVDYEKKAAKSMGGFILFAVIGLVLWGSGAFFVAEEIKTLVLNIAAILSGLWAVSRFLNALALGGIADGMKEAARRLAI